MHIWAMREFTDNSYIRCVDRMNQHRSFGKDSADALLAIMTRREKENEVTTVYIGLSDPLLLTFYPDFQETNVQAVPRAARLLYGEPHKFAKVLQRGDRRLRSYCR